MRSEAISKSCDIRIPAGTEVEELDTLEVYGENVQWQLIDTMDRNFESNHDDFMEELEALRSIGARGHIVVLWIVYNNFIDYVLGDREVEDISMNLQRDTPARDGG